jgi:iron complex outermembrane receptor protein
MPTHRPSLIPAALLCLLALPAFAQNKTAATEDPVVKLSAFTVSTSEDQGYRAGNSVSATRIDTAIKDLPFSVNAFTAQFISDIGARSLNDILAYAPGVTPAGREFGTGDAKVNIRGFESDPQRNGFPSAGYIDAATIARVEVVKGPASLLYGQIAPGGVVNYISKRPGLKPGTDIKLSGGSYHYLRTSVDVNQPLASDKLLFRFNGAWENGFQWVDKTKSRTTLIAPVLTWRLTENSALTLDYQWFKRRDTPQAFMRQNARIPLNDKKLYPMPGNPAKALAPITYFGSYALDDRRYNASSAYDYSDSDYENFFAEYAVKLGADWNVRAVFTWDKGVTTGYQHSYGDVLTSVPYAALISALNGDYSLENVFNTTTSLLDVDTYGAQALQRVQLTQRRPENRTWQVEAAGKYELANFTWKPVIGATWQDSDNVVIQRTLPTAQWPAAWNLADRSTWTDTYFPLSAMPENLRRNTPATNAGVYTANFFSFLHDRLLAVAGLRWSQAESQTINLQTNTAGIKFKTTKTTPQLGLGWRVRPDVLLYASYSESFTPGNQQLRTAGVVDRLAEPFIGRGYEAGVKTDFMDGRLSATLCGFAIEQSNYTFTVNQINPVTGLTEATDLQGNTVVSNGAELDLTWSPTDNWQAYFSGSYADTHYDRINSPDVAYLKGTPPESTARDRYNLWTRYSFARTGAKGWWLGAGFSYTGKKAEISNNPYLYLPAETIVNATVGYDFRFSGHDATAMLEWKNLTDVDEIPSVRSRGLPRRVVFTLDLHF